MERDGERWREMGERYLDVISGPQTQLPERGQMAGHLTHQLTHQHISQSHATVQQEHTLYSPAHCLMDDPL